MRIVVTVVVASLLSVSSPVVADDANDRSANALSAVADDRPSIHRRAMEVLIEDADAGHVDAARGAATSVALRSRLDGVAYGIDVARRFASAEAGSVARWMTLEEWMRSDGACGVRAVLRRAGLADGVAARVLSERAEAARACHECLDEALAVGDTPARDEVVAKAARSGAAVVPHAVAALAIPPWIAAAGWPGGPTVIRQRMAVRLLVALRARVAVPALLLHVDAPSAFLQFDVLRGLADLSGDAAWKAVEVSQTDVLRARRVEWGRREGRKDRDAVRWVGLEALRATADYLAAAAWTSRRRPAAIEGAPDPVAELFAALEAVSGYTPPTKGGDAGDVHAALERVVAAVRHFEAGQ